MPERLTVLTDEILAMRWRSVTACRMWFTRRGTTVLKLGCNVVLVDPAGEDVKLELIGRAAPLVVPIGTYAGEAKAESDRALAASFAESPTPVSLAGFEEYATEVDDLLQEQCEDPVPDDELEPRFKSGLSAQQAVVLIIQARSEAIEADAAEDEATGHALDEGAAAFDALHDEVLERHSSDGVALQSSLHPEPDISPDSVEQVETEIPGGVQAATVLDDDAAQADVDHRAAWLRDLDELDDLASDAVAAADRFLERLRRVRANFVNDQDRR